MQKHTGNVMGSYNKFCSVSFRLRHKFVDHCLIRLICKILQGNDHVMEGQEINLKKDTDKQVPTEIQLILQILLDNVLPMLISFNLISTIKKLCSRSTVSIQYFFYLFHLFIFFIFFIFSFFCFNLGSIS